MKNRIFLLTSIAFFGWLAISCNSENNSTTSQLIITLVDSEGDYDEVNVDIQGVKVHVSSDAEDDDSGWITLDNPNTGVVDLLTLTNGNVIVIGDTEVPAGKISQIRLLLGPENTLVIGEEEFDLDVPSGEQSGLKLKVNATLVGGVAYTMKLDFDAARSVVKRGNSGKFGLKPVIRVITEAISGAIKGEVMPAAENVAVFAIQGEDTESTYAIADQSAYLVEGVPAGTYKVVFVPGEDSIYDKDSVENVEVLVDQVTMLETVTLPEKE